MTELIIRIIVIYFIFIMHICEDKNASEIAAIVNNSNIIDFIMVNTLIFG